MTVVPRPPAITTGRALIQVPSFNSPTQLRSALSSIEPLWQNPLGRDTSVAQFINSSSPLLFSFHIIFFFLSLVSLLLLTDAAVRQNTPLLFGTSPTRNIQTIVLFDWFRLDGPSVSTTRAGQSIDPRYDWFYLVNRRAPSNRFNDRWGWKYLTLMTLVALFFLLFNAGCHYHLDDS